MGILHLSVLLVVICLAVNHFQSTASLRTLDEILSEIKSIADDISNECRTPTSSIQCNVYKQNITSATSLNSICLAMDKYIRCEDYYCDFKTATCKQVLSDAMVIPYCAEMINFPFNDPVTENITHHMMAAVKLCTFIDGRNCDSDKNTFQSSENIDDICKAAKSYATCLETYCVMPTIDFIKRISDLKSQKECNRVFKELKSISDNISSECRDQSSSKFCTTYKQDVNSSTNFADTCLAMDKYIVCEDIFCEHPTATFTQVLSDAMVTPYCATMTHFPFSNTKFENLSKQMVDAVKQCTSLDGGDCDTIGVLFKIFENNDNICRAANNYGNCLDSKCVTPTAEFKNKTANLKKLKECTANHSNGAGNGKTLDQILTEIKSIAEAISSECTDDDVYTTCTNYKHDVTTSTSLTAICLAMDKYILCEDTFCDDKTATFTQVLSDAMVIPYCAEMSNFPYNDATALNISHQMMEAVKLCTFIDGQNCDTENNSFLKSRNKFDVCKAAKSYATCLDKYCVTSTTEFNKTISDLKGCNGCSILQVSGLLMLLAAVINYI